MPDQQQGGNCYEEALMVIARAPVEVWPKLRVCHGIAVGQGPIEGKRIGHAWVEWFVRPGETVVIDWAKPEQRVQMRRADYYRIGQIVGEKVVRYRVEEAIGLAERTGHCGPWSGRIAREGEHAP